MTRIWFSCSHNDDVAYPLSLRYERKTGHDKRSKSRRNTPRMRTFSQSRSCKISLSPFPAPRTSEYATYKELYTSKEERYIVVLLSGSDGNTEERIVSLRRIIRVIRWASETFPDEFSCRGEGIPEDTDPNKIIVPQRALSHSPTSRFIHIFYSVSSKSNPALHYARCIYY